MNHLWIWLQLWLQEQFEGKNGKLADYVASFPFIEKFQGWPVVRRIAPGVFMMIVWHTGPRRVQDRSGWKPPALTGVAVGVLYYFAYGPAISGGTLTGEALLQNSVYGGVFVALVSIPFWKLAQKTRLVIRFNKDGISWRGPDRQKQRVKFGDVHSYQVIAPHRWAEEERRKHQNWMQSHSGQPGPKPLFQTASEVTLNTGPEGTHWRTVAEFCNDGRGELASRLMRAIEVVERKAEGEETERKKKAAANAPL